jgi:sec-independent protein translocase protein TatA
MITSSIFLAPGAWQIILIVVVVLLMFGGKKIPELMRGLGSGIKEFKDASKDEDSTIILKTYKKAKPTMIVGFAF